MFGFLKKKLKEGIEKISKSVSEKEQKKIEEAVQEVKQEEHIEQPKEELAKQVEQAIESPVEEKAEAPIAEVPEEKPIEGVMITYFVHGTTTDNEKSLHSGWSDSELSEKGKKQSIELQKLINVNDFDAIFCSDLRRAVESARLTFGIDASIKEDDRLRECNYGDLNGKEFDLDGIITEHINHPFKNGESYRNVEKRVAGFLNFLFENYYGKRIAIVSHRAPQLALDVLLKGKSWKEAMSEDWRLTKGWQPGWTYEMNQNIEIPEEKEAEAPKEIAPEPEIETPEEVLPEPEIEAPKEIEKPIEEIAEKPEEIPAVEKQIVVELEKEVEAEVKAEAKIEEAKEIFETAKEVQKIEEEKLYEEPESFEKAVEEKLIFTEEVPKEEQKAEEPKVEVKKKGIIGRLFKRKPKVVEAPKEEKVAEVPKEIAVEKVEQAAEEKGIIEKIKRKVTEKKLEEDDVKDMLKDLEMSLLSSDVAMEASEKIINDLRGNLVGNFIKRGDIEKVVKKSFRDSITEILDVDSFDLVERVKTKKPFLIVFLGFNGVGKTTSIARVGYLLKNQGLTCVFAAADSWRAAAIEQLEEHGRRLGIEVVKQKYGSDPAAVIFDAAKHAKAKGIDVVLADTAGRSHSNVNLMDELKKIIKVNSPDLKVLVLDALTGNDIYDQCKLFNDAVGVDGLILTKADVYEKGGAALSASFTIKKPILYLGVGQEYENFEKFEPEKIVERLLE